MVDKFQMENFKNIPGKQMKFVTFAPTEPAKPLHNAQIGRSFYICHVGKTLYDILPLLHFPIANMNN